MHFLVYPSPAQERINNDSWSHFLNRTQTGKKQNYLRIITETISGGTLAGTIRVHNLWAEVGGNIIIRRKIEICKINQLSIYYLHSSILSIQSGSTRGFFNFSFVFF